MSAMPWPVEDDEHARLLLYLRVLVEESPASRPYAVRAERVVGAHPPVDDACPSCGDVWPCGIVKLAAARIGFRWRDGVL